MENEGDTKLKEQVAARKAAREQSVKERHLRNRRKIDRKAKLKKWRNQQREARRTANKETEFWDKKAAQVKKETVSLNEVNQELRDEVKKNVPAIGHGKPNTNRLYRELAKRVLSQRELLLYVQRMDSTYKAGWFHKLLCQHLVWFSHKVVAEESPRLIIEVPPRHGKSRLVSGEWPSWHLGRWPQHEFIGASYSADLQVDFSRKIRDRMEDTEHKALFAEARVDPQNRNATGWRTVQGGGYLPAGVGGPITGKGAHVLDIDDPVKNAQEALSETMRQGLWDWYGSTARTRLAPGAGVCATMTRWHDDDLVGRLKLSMEKHGGEQFIILHFPAIAVRDEKYRKEGEALHSERYPLEALKQLKQTVDPWVWNSLYQQNPVPDDGDYFTKEMLGHRYDYDRLNKDLLTKYTTWDLAITQKDRSDYTVGIAWGLDGQENIYILDVQRFRAKSDEIVERILNTHSKWGTLMDGIEKGHIEEAIGPFLRKRMEERKLWTFTPEPLKPGKRDKELRARPIQGRMRMGKVFLPTQAPWIDDFCHELMRFPNGVKDDQVDATAWIGQMLDIVSPPQNFVDAKELDQKPESWRSKLKRRDSYARDSWMAA